jgi:hypothetical protein
MRRLGGNGVGLLPNGLRRFVTMCGGTGGGGERESAQVAAAGLALLLVPSIASVPPTNARRERQ